MADDSSDTATVSIIETACKYARVQMRVFPVHAIDKSPLPGYGWYELATCQVNEVVEDFDRAIQAWGEPNVSVAWALGVQNYVALDFDVDIEPAWARELLHAAAVNVTRRGRHLIFRQPDPDNPCGNGVSAFPTQGWGEVRGAGGYIVIAGPDRPGFDPQQLDSTMTFPHPEWLTPYGGYTNAATKAEVRQFADDHSTGKGDQYLHWLTDPERGALRTQWHPENAGDSRFGRHPLATEWLAKIAEESSRGLYPFREGVAIVKQWWRQVVPQFEDGRDRWGREWDGMLTWAVGKALSKQSLPTDDADTVEAPGPLDDDITADSPYLDWSEFWKGGSADHEWLVEGFWPLGRSILIHAPAKEGKSELMIWWAIQMATGIDLLTGERIAAPRRVIYVDYEMTDADVRDRLTDFGIDESLDLSNLMYAMRTDDFTGLDTPAGAALCLARIDRDQPDAIIFDTFSRCVDGDENDADTVRAFYRYTGRPIKQRRISYSRLDHTGKDHAKGARGSSAKNDDVDLIWSMRRNSTGTTLTSKSRVSWVPQVLHMDRLSDERVAYRRAFEADEMVPSIQTTEKVYQLAEAGIDPDWSFRQVREALLTAGLKPGKNSTLMAAIKSYRDIKARGNVVRRPTERTDDGNDPR